MNSNNNVRTKKYHLHIKLVPTHLIKRPTESSSTIGVGCVLHLYSFVFTPSSLWGPQKSQSKSSIGLLKHI